MGLPAYIIAESNMQKFLAVLRDNEASGKFDLREDGLSEYKEIEVVRNRNHLIAAFNGVQRVHCNQMALQDSAIQFCNRIETIV